MASSPEDTPLSGTVVATDPEGASLSYSVVTAPTRGTLVLNANGGDDSFSATGNLAALIQITVDGGAMTAL